MRRKQRVDGDAHPVLLPKLGGDGGDRLGRPLLELASVGVPADTLAAVRVRVGLVVLVATLGAAEGSGGRVGRQR
jgi:hypothetical protein